jgi:hypothetical protein
LTVIERVAARRPGEFDEPVDSACVQNGEDALGVEWDVFSHVLESPAPRRPAILFQERASANRCSGVRDSVLDMWAGSMTSFAMSNQPPSKSERCNSNRRLLVDRFAKSVSDPERPKPHFLPSVGGSVCSQDQRDPPRQRCATVSALGGQRDEQPAAR